MGIQNANVLSSSLKTPVLAYANYSQPFQLHTDASEIGLDAVLFQDDEDGKRRVVAFASLSLFHSEKQYPTHILEFLALKIPQVSIWGNL